MSVWPDFNLVPGTNDRFVMFQGSFQVRAQATFRQPIIPPHLSDLYARLAIRPHQQASPLDSSFAVNLLSIFLDVLMPM